MEMEMGMAMLLVIGILGMIGKPLFRLIFFI